MQETSFYIGVWDDFIDSDRKVSLRKCVPFFSHHDGRFNSNIDDPIIIAYATVITTLLLTTPTVSHFTEIRSSLFSLIVFLIYWSNQYWKNGLCLFVTWNTKLCSTESMIISSYVNLLIEWRSLKQRSRGISHRNKVLPQTLPIKLSLVVSK